MDNTPNFGKALVAIGAGIAIVEYLGAWGVPLLFIGMFVFGLAGDIWRKVWRKKKGAASKSPLRPSRP